MRPRREEVEALFEGALDLSPDAQAAWLAERCADGGVLAEVRALLAASGMEGILDGPSPDPTLAVRLAEDARAHEDREDLSPGARVGPYNIVREVGRGGMAVVYLAERGDDHYQQRVAVKIIRSGPNGRELARRFLAERQIMAALQHPHIARLLDGGVLDDGRPWLAMEYVRGLPVDAYCDQRRLTVEERLRIFCTVAWAIHHAHRNLVVHRDLKPSNILLTDAGDLRLMDFGIAKILDPNVVPLDSVPLTRTGLRVMTPEYASPEQLRGTAVTTATDVYALGVVLCELLTSRRPFPSEGRTLAELEQSVLLEEPPRPSALALRDGEGEVALARNTTPRRLRRKLSGDLDRIVLTALRKDPERRYESAQAMAADVQRFLEGRPLAARGDAVTYRTGKFVSRNRWWVGAAAVLGALLVAYTSTLTVEERRVTRALEQARLEAAKSEQVTQLVLDLFGGGVATPRGDSLRAQDLLAEGVARAAALGSDPAAEARMLDVVGRIHRFLGDHAAGAAALSRALDLRRSLYGEDNLEVAESQRSLADAYATIGRLDDADPLYRSALATETRLLGPEHPRTAGSLLGLSRVLRNRGDYEGAEALARSALAAYQAALPEGSPAILRATDNLAGVLRREGRHEEAGALARAALVLGAGDAGSSAAAAEGLTDLALESEAAGSLATAESLHRQALRGYRTVFGDEHPAVAAAMTDLGIALSRRGVEDEARDLLTGALAMRRRLLGDGDATASSMVALASHLRRGGELDGAETLYLEAIETLTRVHGARHASTAAPLHGLARVYRDRGEAGRATSPIAEAVALRRASLGSEHPLTAAALHEAGVVARLAGDRAAADRALREALATRRRLFGDAHPSVRSTSAELAALHAGWGHPEEAKAFEALARGGAGEDPPERG